MRGGARLLPGVTLDFTVRHTEKTADRDGFGNIFDPALAGTLATAFDDRSTLGHRVLLAGANLRWDTPDKSFTQEVRASHNGTVTTDTDRTFFSISKNTSENDKISYLATYRLDGSGHQAGVFRPHREGGRAVHARGHLRRRPAARARPHRLYGRMARRISPTVCS